MRTTWLGTCLFALLASVSGCGSSPDVIPESLQPQIDKTVTFNQVIADPGAYKGKLVVLGGEVLKAKGTKGGTQLEVLELPLDNGQRPEPLRTASHGRFLAFNREFLDPAQFVDGTPVTIVGEITGASIQHLDEVEYRYPTVEIKHLYVWDNSSDSYPSAYGPRIGVFGGVGVGGGRTGGGVGIGTGF